VGAFEPALTRADEVDSEAIWRCAAEISRRVVRERSRRTASVGGRTLPFASFGGSSVIFRESTRNPFPNWRNSRMHVDPPNDTWREDLHVGQAPDEINGW